VARTQTQVVLKHAFHDLTFSMDKYIAEHQIVSLLCMPIVHKKKLLGILYLENNLVKDVFTQDKNELLKVISAQCD
jgi:GAF domain-containing protein